MDNPIPEAVERLRLALKMHDEHRTTLQSLASSVGDFLRDYTAAQQQGQPAPPSAPDTEVSRMDAIVAAFNTWPADLRAKLSLHDLRRMTGWTPSSAPVGVEAIKSAIAELDALRNAMFKTYAAAANGADKAKLIRLIESERNAYESHYSLPKLQAALAQQPAAPLAKIREGVGYWKERAAILQQRLDAAEARQPAAEVVVTRDDDGEIVRVTQGDRVIAATTHAGGKQAVATRDALRKDAERYRYLRKHHVREWISDMEHDRGAPSLDLDFSAEGHDLDAAIDRAMRR